MLHHLSFFTPTESCSASQLQTMRIESRWLLHPLGSGEVCGFSRPRTRERGRVCVFPVPDLGGRGGEPPTQERGLMARFGVLGGTRVQQRQNSDSQEKEK